MPLKSLLPALAGALLIALCPGQAPHAASGRVALIEIEGPIGPATSGYFEKAHREAIETGARTVILRIDTPGGLDSAMRDIIKRILASPVPVVGFVGPGGARAASAGTYILYACHVAAMAPATNLGAATPVPVGGGGFPGGDKNPLKDKEDAGKSDEVTAEKEPKSDQDPTVPESAMGRKVLNDAVAYIRGLAEKRSRNADWAERAVREGVSLSSNEAQKQNVIDLVANDVDDLLEKIDGREVDLDGETRVLKTAGAIVDRIEPDWRMAFLAVITNPTVAYLLMLAGIYGLLLEGYNPGSILPGVVGAICLLLALFAFQVLPVNYVGLGLLILGVVLMIAEAMAPSFGVLGFGGVAAFIFGSVMLMDIDVPGYGINRGVIFGVATGAAGLMALTLYFLWSSRQAVLVSGEQTLIGHTVEVDEDFEGEGWGFIAGERWKLQSAVPLKKGDKPKVVAIDGLLLIVETSTPSQR